MLGANGVVETAWALDIFYASVILFLEDHHRIPAWIVRAGVYWFESVKICSRSCK